MSPAPWLVQWFCVFNDTATTEIYTLSLHDALPISHRTPWKAGPRGESISPGIAPARLAPQRPGQAIHAGRVSDTMRTRDRKSTRLNSSHANISYAVFCLKNKYRTLLTHTICIS